MNNPINLVISRGYMINELLYRLNMFLVHIKLRLFKFSPYLILIVFLVPKKNYALCISPCSIQICLIYA